MSKKIRREIPCYRHPIIESHCHLDYLDEEQLADTLQRAKAVGIEKIITIAVSPDNLQTVADLTNTDSVIFGTQGIHPHEASQYSDAAETLIRKNLALERILAVGEIGLDYYYEHSDRSRQREVFATQLEIAADFNLPVVIHTREADEDTRSILREFSGRLSGGVIHSFTSGIHLAEFCLAEGFYLGFNGITTFNSADNVRDVVRMTPAERILLETDSPYLTPVPYRGRPNAPFYLPFVAEKVAELKGVDIEEFLATVYHSTSLLFFSGAEMPR